VKQGPDGGSGGGNDKDQAGPGRGTGGAGELSAGLGLIVTSVMSALVVVVVCQLSLN